MPTKSRLHVPAPPARPGQPPDFSYLQLSPAGVIPRPETSVSWRDIERARHRPDPRAR